MPEVDPNHQVMNRAVGHPPVYHTENGPMYVLWFPCTCGIETCVQPVLVDSRHMRALEVAPHGGVVHVPLPDADRDHPHVPHQRALPPNSPDQRVSNDFAAVYVVDPGNEQSVEYPMYPDERPRQSRRRNRARRTRRIEENNSADSENADDFSDSGNVCDSSDSGNASDVDR